MSIKQPININSINNNKKIVKIKANDEDLAYLTKETAVIRFLGLEGILEIKRNFNRFIIEGEIIADFVQEDSLTLEEINTNLVLPIRRIFQKEVNQETTKKLKETIIILDKEDDVDILENDTIDICSICLEELLLNINYFIKK